MYIEIRVFAPATVSNIGCGFDIMGFALEQPGDEVVLRVVEQDGVSISTITGDGMRLPYDISLNTASVPVIEMKKDFGITKGIEIEIHKKMAFGSGLGSSAASAVAAAFAMNLLFDLKLSPLEITPYAIKGEMVASGSVHADNVAPSLFGGFTLIRGYNPLDIIKLDYPETLYCTIVHPHLEISTKMARELLPKEIPLKNAVRQWGNCSGLVAGLLYKDFALIGRSLHDVVAEPYRAGLIPDFYKIKQTALDNGAVGCSISGSGPSVFALSDGLERARNVADAISNLLSMGDVGFDIYLSPVNKQGPKVLYIR